MPKALATFRNPGDIQRVEEGDAVRYKRVMLLSPGVWTDAGSEQTVDYSPDGIRASAENFVDIDAVREQVPEWPQLSNAERVERLRELGDAILADEAPINFLHGPALYGAESLDEVGEIPMDSIIVDDEGRMYGDLVLSGDSSQSETAIDLMDEALEAAETRGVEPPPVGPSVEIPADDVEMSSDGIAELQEAFFSAVGVVFNPASRPVELGMQARERAVAMAAADDEGDTQGVIYRTAEADGGQTLKATLRHRWRMGDEPSGDEPPAFEDMTDEELRRTLETMQEDMDELEAALQGDEELGAVLDAVQEFASAGEDLAQGADAFRAWAAENTDLDEALLDDVLSAYLEAVGAGDLSETPVEELQAWLNEMAGGEEPEGGDGEGGENPEEEEEPTMEDLEAVKDVVGTVSDHLGDIKDMLTAREEEREEQLGDLERRLQDIEDEPVRRSLTGSESEEFYSGDGEGEAEAEHEDVIL